MNKKLKHKLIEILPRALWIIFAIIEYFAHRLSNSSPMLNDNILILCIGCVLTIIGFILWMYVGYYMRRAFFTKELLTDGPFKYSRHPMYISIYIMLTGVGILFFSWLWFVVMLIFIPVFYWDCKIEEKQMTKIWKDKYIDYKKKTGIFLPKL